MAQPSTAELLDLDGFGLRVTGFRWQLLDQDLGEVGWVHPHHGQSSCRHDSGQLVMRTIDRVVFEEHEWQDINVPAARIRPWLDLSNGDEECIGTFAIADAPKIGRGSNRLMPAALVDLNAGVRDAHLEAIGLSVNMNVGQALEYVGTMSPALDGLVVEPVDAVLAAPQSYGADRSLGETINAIGEPFGYYNLARDRWGTPRMLRVIEPSETPSTQDYDTHPRLFADGFTDASDVLLTRNRWKVVDSSGQSTPAVGFYELVASEAMAPSNRGWVQGELIDVQGLAVGSAQEAAVWAAIRARRPKRTLEFSGPIDPRHDLFDVVELDSEQWVELGWSMQLRAGGAMTHYVVQAAEVTAMGVGA